MRMSYSCTQRVAWVAGRWSDQGRRYVQYGTLRIIHMFSNVHGCVYSLIIRKHDK